MAVAEVWVCHPFEAAADEEGLVFHGEIKCKIQDLTPWLLWL
jgi:hypothetical protein